MRRTLSLLVKFALGLALIWLAGFVWFMLTLGQSAADDLRTDAVVVLTGGPGRLARGIEVLRAGQAERLFVSGVDPSVRPAELAAELDVDPALFACCVDLGKRAANTVGNGAEIAAWARGRGYRSLRIVTASDHMRRALTEIESRVPAEIALVPDAVPTALGPVALAREYTKYAARRIAVTLGGRDV